MNFTEFLKSGRPVIWDGAMGTTLALFCHCEERKARRSNLDQSTGLLRLTPRNDISAKCNEELNLLQPELVKEVHLAFLNAGAQVIETNTFGANRIILKEHGLADKVREINLAGARIARGAVSTIAPSHHRTIALVSASIGPTSKLPTLGHISFDEMVDVYREQASALIEGGVDIFQIETCQDILQAKAAVIGCKEASSQVGKLASWQVRGSINKCPLTCKLDNLKTIPIIVTITIEPNGTTLLGTEVGAALTALAPLGISAFGLNCATGPAEMEEHIRYLRDNTYLPIAVLPNAGLPEIKDGTAHYPLSPREFAEWMGYFVRELGVQIVGGCCGTTPEHISAMVRWCDRAIVHKKRLSNRRTIEPLNQLASLYSAVSIVQEPRPLIIGERMNINGSREFREHILNGDFDSASKMAKRQAEGGAHLLDLSAAYAGRDETADMHEMAKRLATASPLPIMIDSTNPEAIEAALSHLGGRSIINSINLEDGGKRAERILEIAIRHGAALVGLTIDEEGMALTADKKIRIAERLIKFCAERGFTSPLFIDPLTFTLADPKAADFGSGRETLKAVKALRLKGGIYTILGISNISYGLKPEARRVLNSIFLHEAVRAGLSAAIVHPGQILPLHKIDDVAAELALQLIHCKSKTALMDFVRHFEAGGRKQEAGGRKQEAGLSDEKRLEKMIIDGDKTELQAILKGLLKDRPASGIINNILLPSMQKVGDMFGRGELALPFVLQSAEAMRAAVDLLAPHMGGSKVKERGVIVLATVRGDVHDIGKNLVDIILSNNGYKVVNLGVKQPIDVILKAAVGEKASAIGLSGLLVQSCLVMKEDLAELSHRGVSLPVICGGAALTRRFVEDELQKVYKDKVYYAKDAFEGLRIMRVIASPPEADEAIP